VRACGATLKQQTPEPKQQARKSQCNRDYH